MQATTPGRLYALDNLRALMMWLGIVLHVAVIHVVGDTILPWRDEKRTMAADISIAFIHSFRMPVFFMLAGFFVMLLMQSRGAKGMAEHRLLRLGMPFAVFWFPISIATALIATFYVYRMKHGDWGFDPRLLKPPPGVPLGPTTMHMWFLWLLLWLSLATAVLAQFEALRPSFAAGAAFLRRLGASWWGFLVFGFALMAVGMHYPYGLLHPSGQFLPPVAEWLHNGLFFAFGAAMYVHRDELFALYARRWWVYAVAGIVPFMLTGALMEKRAGPMAIGFAYNCATWLWSFAAIGIALRLLARQNAWLGYLSRSSYWVYLIHLPLTVLFGLMLYGQPLPALVKIAINIAATTAVALATYELYVRSSWVGQLLNGRRDPPRHATPLAAKLESDPN